MRAPVALLLLAWGSFSVEAEIETRTLHQTFPADDVRELILNTFHGSLVVTGQDAPEIRMRAVETVSAPGQEELRRARREVSLEVRRGAGRVVICADGPFRDPDDCTEWARRSGWDESYTVRYDVELSIPHDMNIDVRTVYGEIRVDGVAGAFDVRGVEGGVEMVDISGSGRAQTVQGPLRVTFSGNPAEDSEFRTVSGDIDVAFRDGLSADMTFETMSGEVLTDFEYALVPLAPVKSVTPGGGTRFRMDSLYAIRVGRGGPRLKFANISGDIVIRKHTP